MAAMAAMIATTLYGRYGALCLNDSPCLLWGAVCLYGRCGSRRAPSRCAPQLLQAAANHRQSHTGQLSAATTALLLAGSAARVFTAVHVRTPPHRGHTDTAPHSGHGGS